MITDYLIIGSGIAGLSLALKLSRFGTVSVITKKHSAESNTNYAQGGIAAVMDSADSFESHIADTLDAGAGLCRVEAVEKIVREGPQMIRELIEIGAKFSKEHGRLELGKEGGHSMNRIIHAKDLTGKEVERALLNKILSSRNIRIFEYYFAIDLLTYRNLKKPDANGKACYGVYALNVKSNKVEKIIAGKTILATGGAGQVYLHTTNPSIATGDGIAMGYRAGCDIANMEFIQFHPTSLHEAGREDNSEQVFLISEAVRGAGAVLKSKSGKEFMRKYDKRGSLAPRDIVARAIDNEMKKSSDTHVMLDMRPIGKNKIAKMFPNICKRCLSIGIDPSVQMVPVVPAAHYTCGGIKTDLYGQTNLRNLYASGEVTMTGVHGANRLASNSLLEAMVFSDAIFEKISQEEEAAHTSAGMKRHTAEKRKKLAEVDANVLTWNDKGTVNNEEWILISHNRREIKEIMSDYVGIVRNTYRLERAYRRIDMIKKEIKEFYDKTKVTVELLELRNLAAVAYLIIASAMKRHESRGLHYMLDYPKRDDINFLRDTVIRKEFKKHNKRNAKKV
ncbi:MAG: L-aspartate oxidase [Ignavibacteria bacterium]|nr:L-aspartate oxidase [Ignavibacteria bacterium]